MATDGPGRLLHVDAYKLSCRLCGAALSRSFVDLGMSPLCESYICAEDLDSPETTYPLHVRICERCLLVQLPAVVPAEQIFSEYAYFSSHSRSWVAHAAAFATAATQEFQLTPDDLVVEVASNDGYLLQHFLASGQRVLGIEPAANVAKAAIAKGISTEILFLGARVGIDVAERHGKARLVVGNNVLAHVPDLVDFVAGLRALVADNGVVVLEFPHLLELMRQRQYDTIYHEHFSYFTLRTARAALATSGLRIVDVELLSTHGGSLRVYARADAENIPAVALTGRVAAVLAAERHAGLDSVDGHAGFAQAVFQVKRDLLDFLLRARSERKRVVGYGAPGKGNTLLNHCGVRGDLLAYTVDRNPYKQGKFLPGTHIPVFDPDRLAIDRPHFVLLLPWNLRDELVEQLNYVSEWGGRLVVPIPRLEVLG